jgi:hypothetical protein
VFCRSEGIRIGEIATLRRDPGLDEEWLSDAVLVRDASETSNGELSSGPVSPIRYGSVLHDVLRVNRSGDTIALARYAVSTVYEGRGMTLCADTHSSVEGTQFVSVATTPPEFKPTPLSEFCGMFVRNGMRECVPVYAELKNRWVWTINRSRVLGLSLRGGLPGVPSYVNVGESGGPGIIASSSCPLHVHQI